ncbi:MAG: hypothetical protein COY58_05250 [Gammaproteobacteria bacterium CG_4_10_14_0_8_um_filter_38_16]|nr:MAG: hypothetical protein COY58_05250 [Gammaproteobacteria bacterium CG_4_10_14_0_8_um_filter_38_16]PJA02844.1 MAG: hypothetical protein COX72_08635 [Gammaproteobacteria bacterium CG_4_10_14_0_2_um_filter_38_22]PJB10313.1 MAG: hypothetical protein CO120_05545 [Gammaproteobacteria bacterium CG_4_9_14_3_um_filter_38_9]
MLQLMKAFWDYLGNLQSKMVRFIHISIAFLIISQIIVSNFMIIDYRTNRLNIGTWIHVSTGFLIFILFFIFFILSIQKRGVSYFYPYLFNHFFQLKEDVLSLFKLKLPAVKPGGFAPIVQGLGFGALVLVLVSGLLWFVGWNLNWTDAKYIQSWHKTLTGLVEVYIIAHGVMGIFHFLLEKYFPHRVG